MKGTINIVGTKANVVARLNQIIDALPEQNEVVATQIKNLLISLGTPVTGNTVQVHVDINTDDEVKVAFISVRPVEIV